MKQSQISGAEQLFFRSIKEGRGKYFVEYKPPISGHRFATLTVTFPDPIELSSVPSILEAEVRLWIDRYPVPIMASSFNGAGDLQDLSPERGSDFLIGFKEKSTGDTSLHWGLLPDESLPDNALDMAWIKRVYSDVPWRTQADLNEDATEYANRIRTGWWLVFVWVVILPAAWAVIEWAAPNWLGAIVMLCSVGKGLVEALKLLGKWKKSSRELEREEQEHRKRHYFYHCERNPIGFMRLKAENLEREAIAEIQREAATLKGQSGDRS